MYVVISHVTFWNVSSRYLDNNHNSIMYQRFRSVLSQKNPIGALVMTGVLIKLSLWQGRADKPSSHTGRQAWVQSPSYYRKSLRIASGVDMVMMHYLSTRFTTHTYTHSDTHTLIHTQTRTHSLSFTNTHASIELRAHTHAWNTHALTCTYPPPPPYTHTHTHLSLPLPLSSWIWWLALGVTSSRGQALVL